MRAREALIRSVYQRLSQNQMEELVDNFVHELAAKQKAFFGDVSSQGTDGNWYGMSDWLMEDQ